MNSNNIRPHQTISNGAFRELYTPNPARIKSPALGKTLEYAKISLLASSTISYIDYAGTVQNGVVMPAGEYSFLVQAITACTGAVYIVHDGLKWQGSDDQ